MPLPSVFVKGGRREEERRERSDREVNKKAN